MRRRVWSWLRRRRESVTWILVLGLAGAGLFVFTGRAGAVTALPVGTAASTGAYAACQVFYWSGTVGYTQWGYSTLSELAATGVLGTRQADLMTYLDQKSSWVAPYPFAIAVWRSVCTWAYGGTATYRGTVTEGPSVYWRYSTVGDSYIRGTANGWGAYVTPVAPTWIETATVGSTVVWKERLVATTGVYVGGLTGGTNASEAVLLSCYHTYLSACATESDGVTVADSGGVLGFDYPKSYFRALHPICAASHRSDGSWVVGTKGALTVADRGCVVTSVTEGTTWRTVLDAQGGFDHQGVSPPSIYWTGEVTPLAGGALKPLTDVTCSATTKATPTTKTKLSPKVHFRLTVKKEPTVVYAAEWTYGAGQFSDGVTNWTVTYTYTPWIDVTVIGRVIARLTVTGTDQLYSESNNCRLHLGPGTSAGTVTGIGSTVPGGSSVETNTGLSTGVSTGGCGSGVGEVEQVMASLTPVVLVVCPLEYLFIPSQSALSSWESLAGDAATTSTGKQPAATWLLEIARTAADVPNDLYKGLNTATGECALPAATLNTVPASDTFTVCAGYSKSLSEIETHGHGTTWVAVLGDFMATFFSLFMLIALWYFMMAVAARGAPSESGGTGPGDGAATGVSYPK